MGIVSLNLNYEGIENQNQILIRQDRAAEHHRAAENSTNSFIQENIIGKENVQEIKQKLDIILNQTK